MSQMNAYFKELLGLRGICNIICLSFIFYFFYEIAAKLFLECKDPAHNMEIT